MKEEEEEKKKKSWLDHRIQWKKKKKKKKKRNPDHQTQWKKKGKKRGRTEDRTQEKKGRKKKVKMSKGVADLTSEFLHVCLIANMHWKQSYRNWKQLKTYHLGFNLHQNVHTAAVSPKTKGSRSQTFALSNLTSALPAGHSILFFFSKSFG